MAAVGRGRQFVTRMIKVTKIGQIMTTDDKNGQLSALQIRALDLMVAGLSDEEIGRQLGKSSRTIKRWKNSENFRRLMGNVRQKVEQNLIDDYSERVTRLGLKAMDVVERCLDDEECSLRVRLQAARLAGKWADLETPESKAMGQLLELMTDLKKEISEGAYHEVAMAIAVRGGFQKEDY